MKKLLALYCGRFFSGAITKRRLALSLFYTCLSSNAFANIMVFNKSQHDVEITYHFCINTGSNESLACETDINKTIIKGIQDKINKNYIIISAPPISSNKPDNQVFFILTAIEKDERDEVIAQSSFLRNDPPYKFKNKLISNCSTTASFKNYDSQMIANNAIVLDDMNQSPVITCQGLLSYGGIDEWTNDIKN